MPAGIRRKVVEAIWVDSRIMTALLGVLLLAGCERQTPSEIEPGPVASQHPVNIDWHGEQVEDPYHYLAIEDHPDTQAYILSERQWFEQKVSTWEGLRSQMADALDTYLLTQVKGVPLKSGDYEIYNEQGLGEQYPVFYRRHLATREVEVLLDVNQLASGAEYYRLGGFSLNADASLIAYTEDRTGDENYTLKVRDLNSGETLPESVGAVGAPVAWLGARLCFVLPAAQVAEVVNVTTGHRETLFQESDRRFRLSVKGVEDGGVLLTSESADAVEIRLLRPGQTPVLVAPRQSGHRYRVQVRAGELTILSNARSSGYELALAPLDVTSQDQFNWLKPISGRLLDFERVRQAIAVHRQVGFTQSIVLYDLNTAKTREVVQQGPGEVLQLLSAGATADEVRYQIKGLNRPAETYHYNVRTGVSQLISRSSVPSGFNATRYQVELRWIAVRDGILVPVTLFYRRANAATPSDLAKRPLLMSAYGAYGISMNTRFEPWRFPLLDQGVIFALAHVRGGAELGDNWHKMGSGEFAANAVNDLVDVTRELLAAGIGHHERVAARGVSAGGTLVAAAVNQVPTLFAAVILESPFLDMLNTLDETRSLVAAGDFEEWGNPRDPRAFAAIRSLSPYENLSADLRTDVLLLAAANDQRVNVHESLKWLARARSIASGENLMLIDIDNDSGHLGVTDQYKLRRQVTLEYSFLLNRWGLSSE